MVEDPAVLATEDPAEWLAEAPELRPFTVAAAQHGWRLDQALVEGVPEFSRSYLQQLIAQGLVQVQGKLATKPALRVKAGDAVLVEMRPTLQSQAFRPEAIPLDIVYEDEHLCIVHKAAGMVVHPAPGNWTGTLLNALLARDPKAALVPRAGIVHRLDKDTSGCIVIAKNDQAHLSLTTQFAERSTEKIYLAVVQGSPKQDEGTVFTNIGRHPVNRLKMAVVNPGSGKSAITDWKVLQRDPATDSSLVMCTLHTGRTHQIRVHMLHLGHPLIGDPIYAKPARQKAQTGRLMLHAWKLAFDHPATGERISLQAPVPPEYTPWLDHFNP